MPPSPLSRGARPWNDKGERAGGAESVPDCDRIEPASGARGYKPGGEFASADAATRTPDARLQERRIGAKISLRACRRPEYLLRPTPSHLGTNAPGLSAGGDGYVACRRC